MSVNNVTVCGRLVAVPELKTSAGGSEWINCSVCVNERKKDASGEYVDDPNFFDLHISGGRARWISNTAQKGDLLTVSGRLRQNRWEAKDGTSRSRVEIMVTDVENPAALGRGKSGEVVVTVDSVYDEDIPF